MEPNKRPYHSYGVRRIRSIITHREITQCILLHRVMVRRIIIRRVGGIDGSSSVTFVVPLDAPSTLYYKCGVHGGMGGTINILGPTASPLEVTVSGGKFVIESVSQATLQLVRGETYVFNQEDTRMVPTLYVYRKRVMEPTSPVVPDSILVEHRDRPLRWYVETRIRSTKRTRRMVHTFSKSQPRVMVRNIRVGIRPVRSLYLYRHQIHYTTNRVRRRVWVV